jgi:predicted DNA-binding transcriptional regulator AlpA
MAISIPTPLTDDHLLTTEQLAAITGIARQTFEGWRCRKNGGPAPTKLGPQIIRYKWQTVREWIEAGTNCPGR